MSLVHYVVVRRDLPFGVTCAMIAHAAGESFAQHAFRCSSVAERPGSLTASGRRGGSSPSSGANTSDEGRGSSADRAPDPNREVAGSSPALGSTNGDARSTGPVDVSPDRERRATSSGTADDEHGSNPWRLHHIDQTKVVILGARSEGKLHRLATQLWSKDVPHVAVRETEGDFAGQLMAVGLEPCGESGAAHVREFHLYPGPMDLVESVQRERDRAQAIIHAASRGRLLSWGMFLKSGVPDVEAIAAECAESARESDR